jgi:hypothetical protein
VDVDEGNEAGVVNERQSAVPRDSDLSSTLTVFHVASAFNVAGGRREGSVGQRSSDQIAEGGRRVELP